MKMINEHSAGGVVFRKSKWLVCKHSGYHKWVLPKGIVEEGESPKQAAAREVLEETGVKAEIVKKIPAKVSYKYTKNGTLIDKRVEFYLMKYISGDIKNHSWEMEGVKWASSSGALKLLAFGTERNIVKIAKELV